MAKKGNTAVCKFQDAIMCADFESNVPDARYHGIKDYELFAINLMKRGYGNLVEFANRLKEISKGQGGVVYDMDIDKILEEMKNGN